MFFSIKQLERRRIEFDETFAPGKLEFAGAEVTQATPLHAKGVADLLEQSGGEVRVQGQYSVGMETVCDRCLTGTAIPLDQRFDLFYRPVPSGAAHAGEEVEIDEGEAEIAFYEGAGFELSGVLQEQVLLALPLQRLCRADCRGICPVCGANRNETACGCAVKPTNELWGALKEIHVTKK